jgi:hypothetical protein
MNLTYVPLFNFSPAQQQQMPREKATNLWKDTLAKAALARETALLRSSGSRAAKLKHSQALAAARRQPRASSLTKPTALAAMLGALDELSAGPQAAAKPAPPPRRVPASLRAALEVHAAYASGDPLAALRKHIGTL